MQGRGRCRQACRQQRWSSRGEFGQVGLRSAASPLNLLSGEVMPGAQEGPPALEHANHARHRLLRADQASASGHVGSDPAAGAAPQGGGRAGRGCERGASAERSLVGSEPGAAVGRVPRRRRSPGVQQRRGDVVRRQVQGQALGHDVGARLPNNGRGAGVWGQAGAAGACPPAAPQPTTAAASRPCREPWRALLARYA